MPDPTSASTAHASRAPDAFAALLDACPPEYRFAFRGDDLDPATRKAFEGEAVMVWRSLAPRDPLDWADLRDIAMNGAHLAQLYAMLAQTLRHGERLALDHYLEERLPGTSDVHRRALARGYLAGEGKDQRAVLDLLAADGFTPAVFTARARLRHEDTIRHIERDIAATEKRRQRVLRDLRARHALDQGGRDAVELEGAGGERGG